MGENSAIEWCDHTWNPWIGCARVSPGCDNCYAEQLATTRLGVSWGPHAERRFAAESTLQLPHRWNRRAAREGRRARVFCASLADIFDNKPPAAWLLVVLDTIRQTPHLDWLLLTKRPQQIIPRLRAAVADADAPALFRWDTQPTKAWINRWLAGEAPPNVWLGTTAENQAEADRRIPHLLRAPAAKRFLSCEPLLGPVDLSGWLPGDNGCHGCDDGDGHFPTRCSRADIPREEQCPLNRAVHRTVDHGPFDADGCPANVTCHLETIDWVISGGESGPRARPSHPDWHRSLRDQCAAAGVPFFFKQWGEWRPICEGAGDWYDALYRPNRLAKEGESQEALNEVWGRRCTVDTTVIHNDGSQHSPNGPLAYVAGYRAMMAFRVGKNAAGALLDGVEHRALPHG